MSGGQQCAAGFIWRQGSACTHHPQRAAPPWPHRPRPPGMLLLPALQQQLPCSFDIILLCLTVMITGHIPATQACESCDYTASSACMCAKTYIPTSLLCQVKDLQTMKLRQKQDILVSVSVTVLMLLLLLLLLLLLFLFLLCRQWK